MPTNYNDITFEALVNQGYLNVDFVVHQPHIIDITFDVSTNEAYTSTEFNSYLAEYIDKSFDISTNEAYTSTEFILDSNITVLTSDFLNYVPEYLEIEIYTTTQVESYHERFFLALNLYTSYCSPFFWFVAVDGEVKDYIFNIQVPEYLEILFKISNAFYLDSNFVLYTSELIQIPFIVYVPEYLERSFWNYVPEYLEIEVLIPSAWYEDYTIRAVIPYEGDQFVRYIAQTLGRGNDEWGYEFDDWRFLNHVPIILDISFFFDLDIMSYLDSKFFAVFEGLSRDISFIFHSDITYGYTEPSFIITTMSDNLVEQALVLVSTWVRRPGKKQVAL